MTIDNDDLIIQVIDCIRDEDDGILPNKTLLLIASRLASVGRIRSENQILIRLIEGDDEQETCGSC
tara:strand:- start:10 stop:207 length:198 start_codon:yes stop_codon:yes gene_type:complete